MDTSLPKVMPKISPGTPAYRQLCIAMLLAGLSTFALLYVTQPLLPVFAQVFGLNAEEASLAVSMATGPMAFALLVAGVVSDRVGRRPLMIGSLFLAAVLTVVLGFLPDWPSLLVARFFCGLAISGIPAVAMAFISEEVEDSAVSRTMGLYVAGSAVGGMSGRLIVSALTDYLGWRTALGATGALGLMVAVLFLKLTPASRHFQPRRQSFADYLAGFPRLLRDQAMPWLFLLAFLLVGTFISIYNYIGFRLLAPPFALSQVEVGSIFLLYLIGSASSALAGNASSKYGPRKCLWVPITLLLGGIALTSANSLVLIILGIGVATGGFFGAHSIASAWVSRRARADRAQATASYLFCYYMGSSVLGSVGGFGWTHGGWTGVCLFAGLMVVLALGIAARLTRVMPLAPAVAAG